MLFNFVKVACAVPKVKVGNCNYNSRQTIALVKAAESDGVEIVCFPELGITAYTCQDLFESSTLIDNAEKALGEICEATRDTGIISIVGMPVAVGDCLANCAVAIQGGVILGVVPKTYLPNYKEFHERRWFASACELKATETVLCGQRTVVGRNILFRTPATTFAIEICEDLWAPIPRSSCLALAGAEIIFNLSADNEGVGKHEYVSNLVAGQSARAICGYAFTSCGFGESTQDLVFAGNSFVCENGRTLAQGKRFLTESQLTTTEIDVELLRHERRVNTTFRNCASEMTLTADYTTVTTGDTRHALSPARLTRKIERRPFVPQNDTMGRRCEEITSIQAMGLAKRLDHIGTRNVVIGISGGLDSTLALLVCAKAFDTLKLPREGIIGVTMPGFGTSGRTYTNAVDLMRELGTTIREIPIKEACLQHFKDIGHDPANTDTTYENSQARERTQILMDVANRCGGIVIGTGDLSELALGWATYNGDHMSMYGVNSSIPKTLIRHIIKWTADSSEDERLKSTLGSIADTPISPELIPTGDNGEIIQKTEDKVGPYELHDFFLFYTLRYGFGPAKIFFLAQQAFGENQGDGYDSETIRHWLKVFFLRFFQQQFKRSCMPDGPKVGSCALSPRGDWRMPSDADAEQWVRECDNL